MGVTIKHRDQEVDVAEIDAGRDVVKVRVIRWRNREYLDVRRWWTDDAGELQPGKGLRVNAELLPQLQEGLAAAAAALEDL